MTNRILVIFVLLLSQISNASQGYEDSLHTDFKSWTKSTTFTWRQGSDFPLCRKISTFSRSDDLIVLKDETLLGCVDVDDSYQLVFVDLKTNRYIRREFWTAGKMQKSIDIPEIQQKNLLSFYLATLENGYRSVVKRFVESSDFGILKTRCEIGSNDGEADCDKYPKLIEAPGTLLHGVVIRDERVKIRLISYSQ